jgi:hypothetical protein
MTFINPQIVLKGKDFVQSNSIDEPYIYVWFLLGDPIYENNAEGRFKNPNAEGNKEEILKFDIADNKLKFRADSVAAFCAAADGTGLLFESGENDKQENLPTLKYIFKNTEATGQNITFLCPDEKYGFELGTAGHLVLAKLKDGKGINDVNHAVVNDFFIVSGGKTIEIGRDTGYSLFDGEESVIKDIVLAYGGLTGGLKVNNYNYSGFNVGSSTITISGFVSN